MSLSAISRSFPGRGGPGSTPLASLPAAVASAIVGRPVSFEALLDGA